jgi:hypothetical protein
MKAIVDRIAQFIEEWATDNHSTIIVKNFGFAELVNRSSRGTTKNRRNFDVVSTQPIPITIPGDGSEAEQISLNDEFNFIFWIRTNGKIRIVESEDDSWGLDVGKRQNRTLRIVIAHRNNLGEDLVYELFQDLPERIYLDGFDLVYLGADGEIDDDHETIHNTELGITNYEKHRFTWNIYTINLNIEFIPCTSFESQSIVIDDPITDCITDELLEEITDENGVCISA